MAGEGLRGDDLPPRRPDSAKGTAAETTGSPYFGPEVTRVGHTGDELDHLISPDGLLPGPHDEAVFRGSPEWQAKAGTENKIKPTERKVVDEDKKGEAE